jgi:hypothetical protein
VVRCSPARWGRYESGPTCPLRITNRCSGLPIHVRPARTPDKKSDQNLVKVRIRMDMKG